ncbi:MAG TPA: DUF2007 domain-containing protein [Verrucomicrobiae bacterium]|nr:DUF2007 domain-containing protein [Verrucomicrobiae bacterium]
MVTLRRYTNFAEAEYDKSLLEAAGIPVFLAGENSAAAGYGSVLGELRLQVEEAQVDWACRVLDEHKGFAPLPDDFIPPEESSPGEPTLMNENIDQQILAELRKLRQSSVFACYFAVGVLIAGVVFIAIVRHDKQNAVQSTGQTRVWDDVSAAVHRQDFPRALSLAESIVARNTNDYYGYEYLGYIYMEMGDPTKAETQYSRAYELWPSENNQKNLAAVQRRLAGERTAGATSK